MSLMGWNSGTRPNSQTGRFILSSEQETTVRTELIIFIRPQVIRDSVDAHFVAEEFRTKLRGTINPRRITLPRVPLIR